MNQSLIKELQQEYKELLIKNSKYQNGDDDYALSTAELSIMRALSVILADLKSK